MMRGKTWGLETSFADVLEEADTSGRVYTRVKKDGHAILHCSELALYDTLMLGANLGLAPWK